MAYLPERCSQPSEHWRNAIALGRDSAHREPEDPETLWMCPLCYMKAPDPQALKVAA